MSDILDALAELDAMIDASAATAAVEPVVETIVEDLDALEVVLETDAAATDEIVDLSELEAIIGLDAPEAAAPSDADVEQVEKDLALVEAREEIYEETEVEPVALETKAEEKPVKVKARAIRTEGPATPSSALLARLGSVDAVATHLHTSADDAKLSSEELIAQVKARMTDLDKLPKKVGEKAVNLIAHLAGGAQLSCYTQIALTMLMEKGELTSSELVARYLARPYSEGTSRSQCGQMMALLPALGIAERPTTGKLVLIADSPIASILKAA